MSSPMSPSIVCATLLILLATFANGQSLRSTSGCTVSPCISSSGSTNASCSRNPSAQCYAYELSSTNQFLCAPSLSCSSLDPCIDNTRCASNTSICLLSTCCSRPVCMPQVLATLYCSDMTPNTPPPCTNCSSTTPSVTLSNTTGIDSCMNRSRCLNNGTCQSAGDRAFCLCAPLFYGVSCELSGAGTDLSVLISILNGSMTSYDRTVENVFNRSNWTNAVAVVDVTGSMQPCAAAVYKWLVLAHNRTNLIRYYVFFNDGDAKTTAEKVIGRTGGLYGIATTNLNTVLATMQTAMRNGDGGDGPENDVEALLYGIQQCPNCSNVIHIADNQVTPRDMSLLSNVTKPVKVITCQLNSNPVNADLVTIAARTGGSIHTLEQDIINLAGVAVGGTITIGSYTYRRTSTGYVRV